MKIRTDFVTNSSSSSFITIRAVKLDGSTVETRLNSMGFADEYIFFASSIKKLVNRRTCTGEEILKTLQHMYRTRSLDDVLENTNAGAPLRSITNLKDCREIIITEKLTGDITHQIDCENEDGELVCPYSASVTAAYNVQEDRYAPMQYTAEDDDDNELTVIMN